MTSAEGLCEEVHHLAFHYHWPEREILELPRTKRRRYLAMLSSKLEQLQGNRR